MYLLCKRLLEKGVKPQVVLGFGSEKDVILADEFRALGVDVHITTNDGSVGMKGFVTDAMKTLDYDYFYACGPEPMLKALCRQTSTSGLLSFEERMGCGFGACMGCSCKTLTGYKRICREGPVMRKEEILWEK
jgi:dihydroorotate dehydrogenase electron transfer subunit